MPFQPVQYPQFCRTLLTSGLRALTLTLVFIAVSEMPAQNWQPAVHLPNARLAPLFLELPNGQVLIPLNQGPNAPSGGAQWFYEVHNLSTESMPLYSVDPLNGIVLRPVDFNGNGISDLIGKSGAEGASIVLDAYTGLQRVRPLRVTETTPVGDYLSGSASTDDVDGDGYNDVFSIWSGNTVILSYGDSTEPFRDFSFIYADDDNAVKTVVVNLGTLDGEGFLIKYVEYVNPNNVTSRFYILERLHPSPSNERPDTLETTEVDRMEVDAKYYGNIIVLSNSVWQLPGHWQSTSSQQTLKVTSSGMSIVPLHPTFRAVRGYPFDGSQLYGQGRHSGRLTSKFIDSIPFMHYEKHQVEDGFDNGMELYQVVDIDDLECEFLGRGDLVDGVPYKGGVWAATLIPDIDNDGIQDFAVGYSIVHDSLTTEQYYTALFKTSDPMTSFVSGRQHDQPNGRLHFELTEYGNMSWELTFQSVVSESELSVIDVTGRQIPATITLAQRESNRTVLLIQCSRSTSVALWAKIDRTLIRLQ
jgi:hypothetical protein